MERDLLRLILKSCFSLFFIRGVYSLASSTTPPIVYTIAGSDSGGGAGIQADLHAIQNMGCHGCSAITCLTAQNSVGVTSIHAPPSSFLRKQLDTLLEDMPPRAVKIGMLGTSELAIEVGNFLKTLPKETYVVLDPVMISTSGSKLIQDEAKEAMIEHVFPHADILTPNKYEAEELLGRKLVTPEDVESGAKEILEMGCKAVLIKGGHSLSEKESTKSSIEKTKQEQKSICSIDGYSQDYFLSKSIDAKADERLCDAATTGIWIRSVRYDTIHTHGTGCTLSSSIASALAIGHQYREQGNSESGANSAIYDVDACVLGKAYVTAGIDRGVQVSTRKILLYGNSLLFPFLLFSHILNASSIIKLGEGPGPVAQTQFPSASEYFPTIHKTSSISSSMAPSFLKMNKASSNSNSAIKLGPILPIVDTIEWIERLAPNSKITDIQLRIKNENDPSVIQDIVQKVQDICASHNTRLWINDHYMAAIAVKGVFGVHLGQEDLKKCYDEGGLDLMKENNLALGISTHSFGELAVALGLKPTYISLGPVFATNSKNVNFDPQGLSTVTQWRNLIHDEIPLVAIGGINSGDSAKLVKDAGADCVAVIGAITKADDTDVAIEKLTYAMN